MGVYNQAPIPVTRGGVHYDGTLEAHWSEFLAVHGIKMTYHPRSFDLLNGLIYTPDFLLHELRVFAEVKWELSGQDLQKLQGIAEQYRKSTIVLHNNGKFRIYECADPAWGGMGLREEHETYLARCSACGNYYFANVAGSQRCRRCGHWDGTKTSTIMYYGDGERAKIRDPVKYFASCSYAKDRGKPWHRPLFEPGKPDRPENGGAA